MENEKKERKCGVWDRPSGAGCIWGLPGYDENDMGLSRLQRLHDSTMTLPPAKIAEKLSIVVFRAPEKKKEKAIVDALIPKDNDVHDELTSDFWSHRTPRRAADITLGRARDVGHMSNVKCRMSHVAWPHIWRRPLGVRVPSAEEHKKRKNIIKERSKSLTSGVMGLLTGPHLSDVLADCVQMLSQQDSRRVKHTRFRSRKMAP